MTTITVSATEIFVSGLMLGVVTGAILIIAFAFLLTRKKK